MSNFNRKNAFARRENDAAETRAMMQWEADHAPRKERKEKEGRKRRAVLRPEQGRKSRIYSWDEIIEEELYDEMPEPVEVELEQDTLDMPLPDYVDPDVVADAEAELRERIGLPSRATETQEMTPVLADEAPFRCQKCLEVMSECECASYEDWDDQPTEHETQDMTTVYPEWNSFPAAIQEFLLQPSSEAYPGEAENLLAGRELLQKLHLEALQEAKLWFAQCEAGLFIGMPLDRCNEIIEPVLDVCAQYEADYLSWYQSRKNISIFVSESKLALFTRRKRK